MSAGGRREDKLEDIQGFIRLVDYIQQKAQVPGRQSRRQIAIARYQAQRDVVFLPRLQAVPQGETNDS